MSVYRRTFLKAPAATAGAAAPGRISGILSARQTLAAMQRLVELRYHDYKFTDIAPLHGHTSSQSPRTHHHNVSEEIPAHQSEASFKKNEISPISINIAKAFETRWSNMTISRMLRSSVERWAEALKPVIGETEH
jgi:hypothetical protein